MAKDYEELIKEKMKDIDKRLARLMTENSLSTDDVSPLHAKNAKEEGMILRGQYLILQELIETEEK